MAKEEPLHIFTPKDLHQVFQILRHEPNAVLIAGGTSFHEDPKEPWKKHLTIKGDSIIDISSISELKKIRTTDYGLEVGACITLSQLGEIPRKRLPPLLDIALQNLSQFPLFFQATLGGNICLKPASGDLFAILNVLGAQYELKSSTSTRWLDSSRLLDSPVLPIKSNEVLTRIKIPESTFNDAFFYSDFYNQNFRQPSRFVLTSRINLNTLEDIRFLIQVSGLPTLTQRSIEENLLGKRLPFSKRDIASVISNIKSRYNTAVDQNNENLVERITSVFLDYFIRLNDIDYNHL